MSRDFDLSHISESDAHSSHQNVQQVVESIMQALAALLKHLKREPEEDNKDKKQAEEGPVLTQPEMAESSVEPVNIQQQQLALAGVEPILLTAAPPYQLEGQPQQALLKGSSAEPFILEERVPDNVRIQVGDTAVEGQYGDELREALMQFSPAQLQQLQQVVDPVAQDDIIDAEWEPEPIEIKVNGEPVQVQNMAEQEKEPEPVHTEQLSVDQVERATGQDYSDSPHINDAPVIATVDNHGHILDQGYVKQQVESRVEEAREEDEFDEQREASIEEPEAQRENTPASTQEPRAIETLNQLLETVGAERFEGDRFVLERHGDLMTVTAKDGRGLVLATQGDQVLKSELTDQDFGAFEQVREVLDRQPALEAPTLAAPELAVPELATAGFELD